MLKIAKSTGIRHNRDSSFSVETEVQLARLEAHSASSSINARPAAEASTAVTLEKALLAADQHCREQ